MVNVPRTTFPDFEVINADGARVGYEIVLVRSPQTTARRLQDRIFRASHEIDRRNLSSVNLVVVTDSESAVQDVDRLFVSQRVRLPTNISVTIGMLVRYGEGDAEHYEFVALLKHEGL
jgi:hypothetical protein